VILFKPKPYDKRLRPPSVEALAKTETSLPPPAVALRRRAVFIVTQFKPIPYEPGLRLPEAEALERLRIEAIDFMSLPRRGEKIAME